MEEHRGKEVVIFRGADEVKICGNGKGIAYVAVTKTNFVV